MPDLGAGLVLTVFFEFTVESAQADAKGLGGFLFFVGTDL